MPHDTQPLCKIALVTDRTLLRPTLFTLWTLAGHLEAPAEVHVWGDGLTAADWDDVAAVTSGFPMVTLHCRDIAPEDLAGASCPCAHISAAAMGRLFIPRHIRGRVLYLDGDTYVTGDVSPLFAMDLKGARIGAVRDYVVSKWLARRRLPSTAARARLDYLRAHVDPGHYFNSGVLLIDCDAIAADPELLARFEDVAAASATEWGDQDHLNFTMKGQVRLLNPAYNSSWGRTRRHRGFVRRLGAEQHEAQRTQDRIVHFHGPNKPWKAQRFDLWSTRCRAVRAYRRRLAAFSSAFPSLAF